MEEFLLYKKVPAAPDVGLVLSGEGFLFGVDIQSVSLYTETDYSELMT